MERTEWEKQYREQCYLPVFKEYMMNVIQGITDHAAEIDKKLNGCVESFLSNLVFLQENKKLEAIQTICISFPYTSLVCKAPCLRFEVYPDVPFLEDALVIREFSTPWFFPDWEQLLYRLREEAGKQGMNAVIRMPYIRSHILGKARYLLHIWSGLVKYYLYGIEKKEVFQDLKKAKDFTISFGEYMDWQRPIWISREETDIFFCEEGTDLRFCQFRNVWYEDKVFDSLVLEDCRFYTCTFRNCQFVTTNLQEAFFVGCTFEACSFQETNLVGTRFDGCKFEHVEMEGIRTYFLQGESNIVPALCGNAEFTGCFLTCVNIKNSDLSASYLCDCRMEKVVTQECQLSESFQEAFAIVEMRTEGGKL